MSLTITGIITMVLMHFAGGTVSESDIATFVNVAGVLVGAVIAWYGRYRHGDIDWLGRKVR